MMKKLVFIAGLALVSGSAFAACADTAGVVGGAVPATNTAGNVGAADAPADAQDTCLCNGTAQRTNVNGGGGLRVDETLGANRFIRNGFTLSCSANSMVSMSDLGPSRFAVAGGSRRGNQMHIGNSGSGSVRVEVLPAGARSCTGANNLCTAANVSAALTRSESEVPAQ